jgi:hypothetical protein
MYLPGLYHTYTKIPKVVHGGCFPDVRVRFRVRRRVRFGGTPSRINGGPAGAGPRPPALTISYRPRAGQAQQREARAPASRQAGPGVAVPRNVAMSWQNYVDDQMIATGHVAKGCITGLDGSIWAISSGFGVCGTCQHE